MPKPRYGAKTDENHLEIKRRFETLGCSVIDLNGVIDLIVGIDGVNELIEVKQPGKEKRLTKNQKQLLKSWRGKKLNIVSSIQDCDYIVGLIKMRQKYENK